MRRGRGGGFGLFLLGGEIFRVGVNTIRPVTLLTIFLMVFCYLQPNWRYNRFSWPRLDEVCISVESTVYRNQWKRLLFSAVFHADDMHLYYNMVSFLWKSRQLERKFGSNFYAFLLIALTIATHAMYIGISILLAEYYSYEYAYHCAVGFSGVIFALKVILDSFTPNATSNVMGIFYLPIRYASWFELILISILVPNASFVGHLSGILVGVFSIWLYKTCIRRRNYYFGRSDRLGNGEEDLELRRIRAERLNQERDNERKRIDKLEKEMIEQAKQRSLEDVRNLLPDPVIRDNPPSQENKTFIDPDKELNSEIAEREAMRAARLAKFQK
ncbi:hypothetical protein LOD99_5763 [Oopsacas minuta]|uniref:Peptidase S54 rhomboid domain-containing protein n=1 Tax=Oopsacas minuta TaxID=111878 RepID=A0AAV7JPK7_9METZ|nr:hypothetical protein LOD99_5763 [Oopsacas minuta]